MIECDNYDCGFRLCASYEQLICPYCIIPFKPKEKPTMNIKCPHCNLQNNVEKPLSSAVNVPPKGTSLRTKEGCIYYSMGTLDSNGNVQLAYSLMNVTMSKPWTAQPLSSLEIVTITPVKTAPIENTIVMMWDTDNKPDFPRLGYSSGRLNQHGQLITKETIGLWNHWEVVKQ